MQGYITDLKFLNLPSSSVCLYSFIVFQVLSSTDAGVRILYLPPYSPDLNPIEEAISKVKAWIRRNGDLFISDNGLLYDIKLAMDVITPEDALSYFHHAGYY
jgi:hypothetical protein